MVFGTLLTTAFVLVVALVALLALTRVDVLVLEVFGVVGRGVVIVELRLVELDREGDAEAARGVESCGGCSFLAISGMTSDLSS